MASQKDQPAYLASAPKEPLAALSPKFKFLTHVLRWMSLLLCFVALGVSAGAFIGFAGNDTGLWHLISAAALCFGVGALFAVPSFMIVRASKASLSQTIKKRRIIFLLLLILPWLPLSWHLSFLGRYGIMVTSALMGMISLTVIWAILCWRKSRSLKK